MSATVLPTRHIEPTDWMTLRATRAVMAALRRNGSEPRFVGGCVRDALLGLPASDIDIATPDPPSVVTNMLTEAGIRTVPTGIDHGTVTAIYLSRAFQITTLRKDIETFGRRARVSFTDSWVSDALRRDFTINALYADPDGSVYDPTEDGLADLAARRVRFVGEALRRIDEDYLRVLRFFRFQARFAKGPPDPEALAACVARAHLLPELAADRVRDELFKLLLGPRPERILALMSEQGVLSRVLPEASTFDRLARLVTVETKWAEANAVRRLGALLEANAGAIAERLRFSNEQAERLVAIVDPNVRIHARLGTRAARRMIYRLGPSRFGDLVLLGWSAPKRPKPAHWRHLLALATSWPVPELPVRGADIVDLGVPPGRRVGDLLRRLEDWWVAGDFEAERDACLEWISRRLSSST